MGFRSVHLDYRFANVRWRSLAESINPTLNFNPDKSTHPNSREIAKAEYLVEYEDRSPQ